MISSAIGCASISAPASAVAWMAQTLSSSEAESGRKRAGDSGADLPEHDEWCGLELNRDLNRSGSWTCAGSCGKTQYGWIAVGRPVVAADEELDRQGDGSVRARHTFMSQQSRLISAERRGHGKSVIGQGTEIDRCPLLRAASYLSVGADLSFDNPLLEDAVAQGTCEAEAAGSLGHHPVACISSMPIRIGRSSHGTLNMIWRVRSIAPATLPVPASCRQCPYGEAPHSEVHIRTSHRTKMRQHDAARSEASSFRRRPIQPRSARTSTARYTRAARSGCCSVISSRARGKTARVLILTSIVSACVVRRRRG